MMNTPYMPFYTKNATVCSMNDLASIESGVTHITVSNNCGNENTAASLYFTRFTQLKELVIGDDCFMNVNEVNLIGLNALESVTIGRNSFTQSKGGYPSSQNPNRHFSLKNCPNIRELTIGSGSFSDYSVCEIENVPSLEVIEMGGLNDNSYGFYYSSLELKSITNRIKSYA